MPFAVLILALGIFVINTSEFVIMGLLPEVATDFGVSIPTAGYLISGYAFGVVLGAPLLTPFLIQFQRKRVLIALMGLFTLGNLACAIAPTYELMLTARIITALAQATFFGLGAVVATQLVEPGKAARAIAAVFLGSTIANMFGSPAGTAVGQALGWRSTFVILSGLAAVTAVALIMWLPRVESSKVSNLRAEFAVLLRPEMIRALMMTTLGFGGTFTTFTFIAPMLTDVTGLPSSWVPSILLLFGFGMFLGNPLGGRLADWNLGRAIQISLMFLISVLIVISFVMPYPIAMIVAVFFFGMALFSTIPALQVQVMSHAGDAPVMASAFNIAAFNLGNGLGAWLGSQALHSGVTYTQVPLIGAAMCGAGLLLAVVSRQRQSVRT
ncbi:MULTISPECIES: MFS transporter [Paracoccaceae]|jgi:DHA1 family inner membrane transport protein|uniref:MFS transporter n=1 Tax=Rhodobacterales TaxID=204455 RepID=UPI001B07E3B6|nr:MFS transporter [Boseongicola sp. H5]MBO6603718.1 MFS transporter [Roseicyclus sp.]MBO6623401.1 MFS transporter [Roseicyclus sp.]MBO6920737.1 MFS transporter [Roseicyclus sp.]